MKNLSRGTTGALLLVVAAVAGMVVWKPPASSADWAAWAQALTTAAALIVALFLPLYQHAKEQRLRADEEACKRASELDSIHQLGVGVQATCRKLMEHCTSQSVSSSYLRNAVGELAAIRAMLGKYTPAQFKDYTELEPAVAVMAAADAIAAHLRHAVDRADQHDQRNYIRGSLEALEGSIDKQVARLKDVAADARRARAL